jgi:4-amino-4-deoxy-L-arabinose transferase-like glycosyltransferase
MKITLRTLKNTRFVMSIVLFVGYVIMVIVPKLDLPLMSYDEAWYAAISHTMLEKKSPFFLEFNGREFYDHPPLGFWLMGLSFLLFGESEITVRLTSVVFGVASLMMLYSIGKKTMGRSMAYVPVFMLASSLWFVYRMRSGNFDVPLTALFLSTYLSFWRLSQTPQSNRWRVLAGLSLGGLVMIKTLVGVGILPVLAGFVILAKNKFKTGKAFIVSVFIAMVLILPWYKTSIDRYPNFLDYHFLTIGARQGAQDTITRESLSQTLLYFRSGVGKWFYPSILGVALTMVILVGKFKNKRDFLMPLLWFLSVGLPFIVSTKTEVWHLLPLYAPLFLLFAQAIHKGLDFLPKKWKPYVVKSFVSGILGVAIWQLVQIMPLLKQSIEYDRKDIALKARGVDAPIEMKTAFLPAFVYYSGKTDVGSLYLDQNAFEKMNACLSVSECQTVFVVDAAERLLMTERQVPYRVIAENPSYALIDGRVQ